MIFRQLFDQESSTYTYLLGDESTREAVIIDCVREQHDRDWNLLNELQLKLIYILETHIHADHVTGAALLRKKTGAKTVVGAGANVECADKKLGDGEELSFGSHRLKALATPGHTDSCTSYLVGDKVFTGDCLLIRGCGRTDFQQGSAATLFASVREKLFRLPDETLVYPAHNYKGLSVSSIGEEKRHNPRLAEKIGQQQFVSIMQNLKLAPPQKIGEALPLNENCGE